MGYYATGSGYILFTSALPDEDYKTVRDILSETFVYDGFQARRETSTSKPQTIIYLEVDGKYYQDGVKDTLGKMIPFGIKDGEICYVGEDQSMWRFIFRDTKWVEENGYIEYGIFTVDRLKTLFMNYILNDLEAASPEYILDAMEQCGMRPYEIMDLGFGNLLSLHGE